MRRTGFEKAQPYARLIRAPSAVSIRLIPAANSSGSAIMPGNGTSWVATPAARTSRLRMPIDPKKRPGDGRADVRARALKGGNALVDGLGGQGQRCGQREHDRRVTEREEEPHAERALSVLQELARRVVDRGDVIDVKGVTKPERVGERTQASESRMIAGVKPEQAPPKEMQQQHPAAEGDHPAPLGARQPPTCGRAPHSPRAGDPDPQRSEIASVHSPLRATLPLEPASG